MTRAKRSAGGDLRVLVVDDGEGFWGAQKVALDLANRLGAGGVRLVLASQGDGALAQEWAAAGHELVEVRLPRTPSSRRPSQTLNPRALLSMVLTTPVAILRLVQAVRTVRPAVVLGNSHSTHLIVSLAARLSRTAGILYFHEELPFRFGRVVRAAATLFSVRSICVSDSIRAGLPRLLQGRAIVVPNGVDLDEFCPGEANPQLRAELGAAAADVLIVDITRIDPVKRVEDAVAALAALPADRAWHAVIIGQTTKFPEYYAELRSAAEQRLADRVTFIDRRSDIAAVLREADVLLHSGVVEGMPLVMLEAQACGTPVVGYRIAAVPTLVQDGATGLLADAGDVEQLARNLETLVADEQCRSGFSKQARVRAERSFGIGRQVDAVRAILLEGGRR